MGTHLFVMTWAQDLVMELFGELDPNNTQDSFPEQRVSQLQMAVLARLGHPGPDLVISICKLVLIPSPRIATVGGGSLAITYIFHLAQ